MYVFAGIPHGTVVFLPLLKCISMIEVPPFELIMSVGFHKIFQSGIRKKTKKTLCSLRKTST